MYFNIGLYFNLRYFRTIITIDILKFHDGYSNIYFINCYTIYCFFSCFKIKCMLHYIMSSTCIN